MNRMRLILQAAVIGLLMLSSAAMAVKLAPPPTKQRIAGVHVGQTDGLFMWAEIDKSGKGLLVVKAPMAFTRMSVYRIKKTLISSYKVSFALTPLSSGAVSATLSGESFPDGLRLKWNTQDLSIAITLRREDDLYQEIRDAKAASMPFR